MSDKPNNETYKQDESSDDPDPFHDEMFRKVMQELGRRGGQSTSKKKRDATKKSLELARKARWPKKGKK